MQAIGKDFCNSSQGAGNSYGFLNQDRGPGDMKNYDVIIIGAGPAGIFAALEIVSSGKGARVLII